MTGPAVDSPARPVDGPVDVPVGGPAPTRWRSEPLLENRAYLELARLLADPVCRGHGVPAGDGRTVLLPGYLAGECNCELARAYRRPYSGRPRLTSISSRRDGMVRWRSCVADYATCVEVPGSHIGLAFNRHAYRAVAEALATPPAPADPGHR